MNEEVMIPKSYHDKVCEEIIRFKDKQFYDAVHLLDDGTLEIHVTDYKMVKRVLVEDDNNFGNLFCEDKADRPQGEGARLQMYDKVRDKINARYGSINKLAKIIGIEAGDLYAAFKGTKPMHPKYKRLISEALGESEDNLFNEEA